MAGLLGMVGGRKSGVGKQEAGGSRLGAETVSACASLPTAYCRLLSAQPGGTSNVSRWGTISISKGRKPQ